MKSISSSSSSSQPQYVFIHDALDELITCGETDIPASQLRTKVNKMRKVVPGRGVSGFNEQFQVGHVYCKFYISIKLIIDSIN